MQELPADVVARILLMTERAKAGVVQHTGRSISHSCTLPHHNSVIWGSDAGTDYALTVWQDLVNILETHAASSRTTCRLAIPSGGTTAQEAIRTFVTGRLHGFEIVLGRDQIDVDWSKALLAKAPS
jgi:hypothetical protein